MIGSAKSAFGFDPRTIPGCSLWLDGADSSTITGTTSVTAWRDKSINGYVANSFVNSVANPSWVSNVQNGNGVIQYTAGNGSSIANFVLAQTMSIFKVYYPINQSIGSPFIEHGPNENSESGFYFHAQSGNNFAINSGTGQIYVNFGTTAVSNTWQMIEGINPDPANGNTMAFYVNGTTRASGSTQSGTTTVTKTLYINGRAGTSSVSYNTYLAELIIYNIALTTSQRQQVEGYLAHKWGLTAYYFPRTPLTIPGCTIWLDGEDPAGTGIQPANGSAVSTWVDKSGNSKNMTVYAGSPVFNTTPSRITFNGSTSLINTTFTSQIFTLFIVYLQTNTAGPLYTTSTTQEYSGFWPNEGGTTYLTRMDGNSWYTETSQFPINTRRIVVIQYTAAGSGGNIYVWSDGTLRISTTTLAARTVTSLLLGSRPIGNNFINGNYNEVIQYDSVLTTTQRQTIEAYLARKWGLTSLYSSIPSTHPFLSLKPHLRVFQPTDISGCQLWLDAADTSSMTLSGTTVTQWNDKSGNGRNTSSALGTTVLVSNAVNKLPGVYFNSTAFRGPFVYSGTQLHCFIVCTIGDSGNFTRILSIGNNVQEDYGSPLTTISFCRGGTGVSAIRVVRNNAGVNASFSAYNTPFLAVSAQYANTQEISVNGATPITSSTSTSAAFSTTTYGLGVQSGPTGEQALVGYICELIVFDTFLTTSQRQQVEGYLAHKWGLTSSLFTPLTIPGCQLWLDGADSSTTTSITSGIWRDKSGNSYNTSYVPSGTGLTSGTINSLPAVTFPGGDNNAINASVPTSTTSGFSIFFVASRSSSSPLGARFIANTSSSLQIYGISPNIISTYVNNLPSSTSLTITTGVPFIFSLVVSPSIFSMWLNGIQNSSTGTTGAATGTTVVIGASGTSYTSPFVFAGQMGEILVYNTALTTIQRQRIEGYLSQKWSLGVSSTNPSTHPFYKIPPASVVFSPLSISGLALWLDAADQTSMTLSGSTVTQWRDKSGNGRNGTPTGSPTLSSGQIVFSGSQWFSGSISNTSANLTAFVVAKTTTSPATPYSRILSTSAGGNDFDNTASMDVMVYLDNANTLGSFRNFVTLSTVTTTPNQTFLAVTKTNATTNIFYLNGTASSTVTLSGGAVGSFGYTTYWVGSGPSGLNLTGTVSEVLYYHADLTTTQRQQVEGYLAQKWGLTGSLPSTHPFKKIPA